MGLAADRRCDRSRDPSFHGRSDGRDVVTFALAVIFFALLMLYCGIGGHSLRHALVGKSVSGAAGSFAGASA